ncbi:MAG TPA: hypothetical protein VK586_03535 [Streptosporangiaceae bacterium]|nr:hypothetical protein [Streptosporangiaceae bacterium]
MADPDRHDEKAVSFRPARGVKPRLNAYAQRTGQSANAVMRQAVDEFLAVNDPPAEQPPESAGDQT